MACSYCTWDAAKYPCVILCCLVVHTSYTIHRIVKINQPWFMLVLLHNKVAIRSIVSLHRAVWGAITLKAGLMSV